MDEDDDEFEDVDDDEDGFDVSFFNSGIVIPF
jgi:hypothetical protein